MEAVTPKALDKWLKDRLFELRPVGKVFIAVRQAKLSSMLAYKNVEVLLECTSVQFL